MRRSGGPGCAVRAAGSHSADKPARFRVSVIVEVSSICCAVKLRACSCRPSLPSLEYQVACKHAVLQVTPLSIPAAQLPGMDAEEPHDGAVEPQAEEYEPD